MSKDRKALLIDNTASYLSRPGILIEEGYQVDAVHNVDSRLPKLDDEDYDVIIVQERPEAESWRLCEIIRHLSAAPLIVISTHASDETCVKAINAGADYFMRKPFGPRELLARIHSLRRHRAGLASKNTN
jgi:DNA-binding response OmpR family regulator